MHGFGAKFPGLARHVEDGSATFRCELLGSCAAGGVSTKVSGLASEGEEM